MLICIGGFPGSGRNRFSHDLSKALGFYNHPLNEIKHSPSFKRIHGATRPSPVAPYSDDLLTQVYQEVASSFSVLSKMYPDIIMKDHFHREVPREVLFREAEKHFGPPLIVWTDASLEVSTGRLEEVLVEDKKKLARDLKLSQVMRADYQPFTREIYTVDYNSNPAAAVEQVLELVKKFR
ncbi:hypothetical protein EXS56_01550 [Candidatus Kaiserbacteria bacterium]|nr:hypothetical protein [Candidatus Kaiserbacteria bacterium]